MHVRSTLPEGVENYINFKIYKRTISELFVINDVSIEELSTERMVS